VPFIEREIQQAKARENNTFQASIHAWLTYPNKPSCTYLKAKHSNIVTLTDSAPYSRKAAEAGSHSAFRDPASGISLPKNGITNISKASFRLLPMKSPATRIASPSLHT
jgi:hypothetical protein